MPRARAKPPAKIAPDPTARAIGTPRGTEVTLADGRGWTLAADAPAAGGVWSDLYDDNVIRGRYAPADLLTAAYRLLRASYDLTPEEAFDLFKGVDPKALVDAVERALFGPPPEEQHQTWGDWAEASLWANGIDPAAIPPHRVRPTLQILASLGLTVPEAEFISSQAAMRARRQLRNFGKD